MKPKKDFDFVAKCEIFFSCGSIAYPSLSCNRKEIHLNTIYKINILQQLVDGIHEVGVQHNHPYPTIEKTYLNIIYKNIHTRSGM